VGWVALLPHENARTGVAALARGNVKKVRHAVGFRASGDVGSEIAKRAREQDDLLGLKGRAVESARREHANMGDLKENQARRVLWEP